MKKNIFIILFFVVLATWAGETPTKADWKHNGDWWRSWCDNSTMELESSQRAARDFYQQGAYKDSYLEYVGALKRANHSDPLVLGALASKAAQRGLGFLNRFSDIFSEGEHSDKLLRKTVLLFADRYFDFIRDCAQRLDRPYYTPSQRNYGQCRSAGQDELLRFERLFLQFSTRQLNLVIEGMTSVKHTPEGPLFFPLGRPRVVLKMMQESARHTIVDLQDNIFAAHFACHISELSSLEEDIRRYLNGHGPFTNDFMAMQRTFSKARDIIASASRYVKPCDRRTNDQETSRVYSWNARLNHGNTISLSLGHRSYVKKILVTLDGWQESKVDVAAEGDVKGTLILPRRDPSYWVTIAQDTDRIDFISHYGDAVVKQVIVYFDGP